MRLHPTNVIFSMSTMVTLRGHGRHDHLGWRQELEQSLPLLGRQIHDHIMCMRLFPKFSFRSEHITVQGLWTSFRKSGGTMLGSSS